METWFAADGKYDASVLGKSFLLKIRGFKIKIEVSYYQYQFKNGQISILTFKSNTYVGIFHFWAMYFFICEFSSVSFYESSAEPLEVSNHEWQHLIKLLKPLHCLPKVAKKVVKKS